ncbi:MAG: tetraacyldisaccharide 4'-kinase [Syntrophales bacterium]|nr:tetraacyldisaccharide 4'-kinase [Syntrophales bacterium]
MFYENVSGEPDMVGLHDVVSRTFRDDRNLLRFLPLLLVSLVYRAGVSLRNFLYDTGVFHAHKMTCAVISVGNIMVGGTGKTPTVIMLADMLKGHGYRPAILSRGYGGKRKGRGRADVVSDGRDVLMGPDKAGDEPVLIARSVPGVPVIVARDRSCAGRLAVERFDVDVLILDDGFQHRRLARDIDIVLLDGRRPFGNGFMLPRGGMREPPNALRRADVVIMTSTGEMDDLSSEGIPPVPVFKGRRRSLDLLKGRSKDTYPLAYLTGKRVCAFSGIARPESFRSILEPLCGEIVSFIPFPDHHVYTIGDVEDVRKACRDSGAQAMVTTEKDGIKLTRFPDFFQDVCMLRIEMEIIPLGREFEEYMTTRLKR